LGCEAAEIRLVGKSVFVKLSTGATAFIPKERFCEAAKRFNICADGLEGIKC
jgi:hypothetical protein